MNDADRARAAVHDEWKDRSGAWEKWADRLSQLAKRFNIPLLDAAGVAAGTDVLDLASGLGEPAITAAERVGAHGRVTATDLVANMIDAARRRAEAAGVSNMAFEVCGMEDLPFSDRSFDAVTCRFGIMFVPDVMTALREVFRVLRPDCTAAFLVWGPIEDNTLFHVLDRVIGTELGHSLRDLEFSPFRFGADGSLSRLMEQAGCPDVTEREMRFSPKIDAGTPFWTANLEMSFGDALTPLAPAERRDLDAVIAEAFRPFIEDDVYVLRSHVRLVSGNVAE